MSIPEAVIVCVCAMLLGALVFTAIKGKWWRMLCMREYTGYIKHRDNKRCIVCRCELCGDEREVLLFRTGLKKSRKVPHAYVIGREFPYHIQLVCAFTGKILTLRVHEGRFWRD